MESAERVTGHRAQPGFLGPVFVALLCLTACSDPPSPGAASSAPPRAEVRSQAKPSLFEVPDGIADGAAYMRGQASKLDAEARATGERKIALVYVGAPWCEPCVRFHDAVRAGQLDAELAGAVLFEFDHDRDAAALQAMDCTSRLIPLFAVPDAEGHCSAKRTEGGIKGDGAVAFMTPKIRALLE